MTLAVATAAAAAATSFETCPKDWLGDGECDADCNNEPNHFDGGDCAEGGADDRPECTLDPATECCASPAMASGECPSTCMQSQQAISVDGSGRVALSQCLCGQCDFEFPDAYLPGAENPRRAVPNGADRQYQNPLFGLLGSLFGDSSQVSSRPFHGFVLGVGVGVWCLRLVLFFVGVVVFLIAGASVSDIHISDKHVRYRFWLASRWALTYSWLRG